ncbi:MAG: zinc ABC transporter substrate-binding protein [Firmicutes bacterium]|nr:zinc ABC transporter substrate-binding protein [Bacillota bacterium]
MTPVHSKVITAHCFAICFIIIFLAGCAVNTVDGDSVSVASGEAKLTVFTTIYPVYYFTSEIVMDKGNVVNLIPSGGEAHHWEPSPRDMVKMNQADALVYSGAGMEAWIDDVLAGLDTGVRAVDCSENIDLLEDGGVQHVEDKREARVDPHIWTNPVNAAIMVDNITKALCAIDPANAGFFRHRRDLLNQKLKELDQDFKNTLQDISSNDIVVSHSAFGYMAQRYGLNQIAVRGISPEVEPGPARLAEIVDTIRQKNIKCVFFESLVSPKISDTIAREAGVKTLVLYTLGGISVENKAQGENYFTLMRKNLANLKEGLGG